MSNKETIRTLRDSAIKMMGDAIVDAIYLHQRASGALTYETLLDSNDLKAVKAFVYDSTEYIIDITGNFREYRWCIKQ